MKQWQKVWVYTVLLGSLYHLMRDILQTIGISTWISQVLVKEGKHPEGILWHPLNTVVIEIFMIGICFAVLRRNNFGKLGVLTLIIPIGTLVGFAYYWF